MLDKYGVGQDPYCYPSSAVLRNRLGIRDDAALNQAEHDLSAIAASEIDFELPPYDLAYLKRVHKHLFKDLYDWAGQIRTVDISKGGTHFCNVNRIEPEAEKLFRALAHVGWLEGLDRAALVNAVAEYFGDLNVIHPFREGNGRAQRILFEHIIVNAGYEISWWAVDEREWIQANIDAVVCNYSALISVFDRCIGGQIPI
ncbi:MAG: cell filamentation protein Fic [Pseudomonas sp.]|nr:cell filamentation protein Fic [Pseudomonas sp.]